MRADGLTLIEVLVSLTIFTVLAVAVLGLLPTILRLNSQTRTDQSVTVAAKRYLESVRVRFTDPTVSTAATSTTPRTLGQVAFDAQDAPAVPASSEMNGYACATEWSTPLTSTADTSGVVGTPTPLVMVRRLTLTCTRSGQPTQTFVLDLGRPL